MKTLIDYWSKSFFFLSISPSTVPDTPISHQSRHRHRMQKSFFYYIARISCSFLTTKCGNSHQNPKQAAILAKKQLTERKQREAALHKRQQDEVIIITERPFKRILFQISCLEYHRRPFLPFPFRVSLRRLCSRMFGCTAL